MDDYSIPYSAKANGTNAHCSFLFLLLIHAIMSDVPKLVRDVTCFSDGSLSIRIYAAYGMLAVVGYVARHSL